jgi:hypothetical protein
VDNYKRAQKLLGPRTFRDALKERVEREALTEWTLREDEPFEVIAPMKTEENPKAHRFRSLPTHRSVFVCGRRGWFFVTEKPQQGRNGPSGAWVACGLFNQ